MSHNVQVYNLGANDTIPASATATGTLITAGVYVTGTGTAFLTELHPHDWIYDDIALECRQVVSVQDDEHCILAEPFTVDIAVAQPFRRVIKPAMSFIGVLIPTGATGNLDGSAVTEMASYNWGDSDKAHSGIPYVNPVVAEVTAGTFIVTTLR